MNIVTLRNVGLYEIPDSYKGILRISPNNNVDNPTNLLRTRNTIIKLSDSEGHELPLSFKVKSVYSSVIGKDNRIDLVQVEHHYKNLYITNELYIKSNLFLNVSDKKPPLLFVNHLGESLGYPIESPYDSEYFNKDNKLNFSSALSYEENIKNIPYNHEIYDITNPDNLKHYEKINGTYLLHTVKQNIGYKTVPILKRRNYILGMCPNSFYKVKSNSPHNIINISSISLKKHNQLSYIPFDKIIYRALESTISGLHRSHGSRYYNLEKTGKDSSGNRVSSSENNLGTSLFGNIDNKINTIMQNSPILGVPAQSGTIHYNAIPAKRYLFHCLRRYPREQRFTYLENNTKTITEANPNLNCAMNTLIKQYVLCDGKNIATDYPNIDKNAFALNWSDTHSAIRDSINDNVTSTDKNFLTPPLFECNQLSLRFLRGLNWIRTKTTGSVELELNNNIVFNKKGLPDNSSVIGFKNNNKIYDYPNIGDSNDLANHAKPVNKVGMYYVNHDNKVQKRFDHNHLLFAVGKGEVSSSTAQTDDLAEEKNIFFGKHSGLVPTNKDKWVEYVKNKNNTSTFLRTHMLKTVGGIVLSGSLSFTEKDIKILQDQPISRLGGSNDVFHTAASSSRHGREISLGITTICTHALGAAWYASDPTVSIKNGRYNFAHSDGEGHWRFLTSLPIQNKYGKPNSVENDYSTAKYGSTTIKIDDSLSSPPSVNFIPLMKI